MKLIGSKIEKDFRAELIKSRDSLFNEKNMGKLLTVLRASDAELKTAYIIDWTPEQGEDIYRVLVNTDYIAMVELDRINPNAGPIVEKMPLSEYQQGLSKSARIKLAVAIDLAEKGLGVESSN